MKPCGLQELQLHKHELVHDRFSMVPIPRFMDGLHAPLAGQTYLYCIKQCLVLESNQLSSPEEARGRMFPHQETNRVRP